MSVHCEKCHQLLLFSDGEFICNICNVRYPAQPFCPDCHQPLEVLKACGAVDYFCRNGQRLISRKRVLFQLPAH